MIYKNYDKSDVYEICTNTSRGLHPIVVIIPPLGFFLGGLMILLISIDMADNWNYFKYDLILTIIMMSLGLILFILFFLMWLLPKKGIVSEDRLIYDYKTKRLLICPMGLNMRFEKLESIDNTYCTVSSNNGVISEKLVLVMKNKKKYRIPTDNANIAFDRLNYILEKELPKDDNGDYKKKIYTQIGDNTFIY